MIAKRIRKGGLHNRGNPRKLVRGIVAVLTYVCHVDPALLIQAEGLMHLTGYPLRDALRELGVSEGEKVLVSGCRNLRGGDTFAPGGNSLASCQAQMLATALKCPNSKHPIEHYVFSWQKGEHPSVEQLIEAVEIALKVLGCDRHQVVWAAHQNTENIHVHIVINRIDPEFWTATEIGAGWDKDRLAQARAIIEARQGWAAEPKATYVANELGEVRRRNDNRVVRSAEGQQLHKKGDRKNDREKWQAQPDVQAIVQTIAQSASWPEVHARLATRNAMYLEKGKDGAVIIFNGKEVKASTFDPACGMGKLGGRIGDFEADRSLEGYNEYKAKLKARNQDLRDHRAAALAMIDAEEAARRATMFKYILEEFSRQLIIEAMEKETRAIKILLQHFYDAELKEISEARLSRSEWARGDRRELDDLFIPLRRKPAIIFEDVEREFGDYAPRRRKGATSYVRYDSRRAAFVDLGSFVIIVSDSDSDVLAALRLAERKWDHISIVGDAKFQEQCLRIARANGIAVGVKGKTSAIERKPIDQPISYTAHVQVPVRSTFPDVYTTKASNEFMKAAVKMAGFNVGMTGQVRWDRDRQVYRVDTTGLATSQLAILQSALTPYTTPEAREAAIASQLTSVDAESREDQDRKVSAEIALSPILFMPEAVAPRQNDVDGPVSLSTPERVGNSRSVSSTSDSTPATTSDRRFCIGFHPLIDQWAMTSAGNKPKMYLAVAAIFRDEDAKKSLAKLPTKLRAEIERDNETNIRRANLASSMARSHLSVVR